MIRRADVTDLHPLSKLFDEYRVFYQQESDFQGAVHFLTDRVNNHDAEIFVDVIEDGQLTGFVQLYPILSSTRMKRLWLLNDLYVHPNYRGNNISVHLINRAKELAIETNACGLILETAKSNIIGNNLYPRTGFMLDKDHNYYSWNLPKNTDVH